MKLRINNIEFRKYTFLKLGKENFYEIVKWYENSYFGKEQEYIDKGYKESFGGEFLTNGKGSSIQKSFFKYKESCIAIAFLCIGEEDVILESVGSRILELSENELQDFMNVYRKANKKLIKKYKL